MCRAGVLRDRFENHWPRLSRPAVGKKVWLRAKKLVERDVVK